MPAQLTVNIGSLILPLVGVQGIDVLVDGTVAGSTSFGQSATVDVAPGTRNVAVALRGVITRTSNAVAVNVNEGDHATVTAKYSRMWGNFKLKMG